MTRPYHFGKDKVHPAPLDPAQAPWSAPRGYTTSIPDEVAAYKASLPPRRLPPTSTHKPVQKVKKKTKLEAQFIKRAWTAIKQHFNGVVDDILPRQTEANPNGDVKIPRLLQCLCCIK